MTMQKKTQTGYGPGPWTDPEHNLLAQMTNDQLKLEGQDNSTVISWNFHWKRVALRLKEAGFTRTAGACREYWKRTLLELHNNDGPTTTQQNDIDGPDRVEGSPPGTQSSPNKRPITEESGDSVDGQSPEPKKNRVEYVREATGDSSVYPPDPSEHGHEQPQVSTQDVQDDDGDSIIVAAPAPEPHSCGSHASEHCLEGSQSPTISSMMPDEASQRSWASKILKSIETDMRAINDAIATGGNKVTQIDLALANLSRDYERDLEAKNAAIKRITEDYEKSLHSLTHKKATLQESRNNEIDKLNSKAKEGSNRSKLWASYKDILTTLNLGKELCQSHR